MFVFCGDIIYREREGENRMTKYAEEPVQVITPENKDHWLKLRNKNINSTDISSLFGLNPYQTEFELWHRVQTDTPITIEQNERMEWGNALESAIAYKAAEKLGIKIQPAKDYWQLPESRLGSSFDFFKCPNEKGIFDTILEVKNVDSLAYHKNWTEHDGPDAQGLYDLEAPPHIELQVQFQLLMTGFSYTYLCALVGGNSLKITKRETNKKLHEIMLQKCEKFWESVANQKAPKIDYERDSEFLISLYDHAEPNKTIQADEHLDTLVHGYNVVATTIKELERDKESWKAKILEHIKDAEKVKSDKYSISAGIMPEAQLNYTRKSFRNFKITQKKQKETM